MGKVLVFLVGLLAGAAAAHVVSRTPTGKRVLATVNDATGEFVQTVADSYRARRAESTGD